MAGRAVRIRDGLVIPARELTLRYVRAGGPGGQNVNKVASKAVLRFRVRDSPSLTVADRERILLRLAARLTGDGELILTSGVYRDQSRNREAVLGRLAAVLAAALRRPRPRRPTRPSKGAVERRLAQKRARSDRKRERRTFD
jgi:ribosome-associated protein